MPTFIFADIALPNHEIRFEEEEEEDLDLTTNENDGIWNDLGIDSFLNENNLAVNNHNNNHSSSSNPSNGHTNHPSNPRYIQALPHQIFPQR